MKIATVERSRVVRMAGAVDSADLTAALGAITSLLGQLNDPAAQLP